MKKLKTIFLGVFCLIIVFFVMLVNLYKLMNSENFQVAGEILPRIETSEKVIALTFDDGPTEHTDSILDVLRERDVWATFYLIGEHIEQHKEEAEKIVEAGHEIGNHSFSHRRMVFKSNQFIREEIEKTDQLIRDIGYEGEITFRPPFGKKLFGLPLYLQSQNKKTITWDVEPQKALGSDATTEEIVSYVKTNSKPGSIILIHPWYGDTNNSRDAIPAIIDALKVDGYKFVTISELLKIKS